MKHLIFALVGSFLISTTIAQNGGQYQENNALKLQFLGMINGINYAKVINKVGEGCSFRVNNSKTEAVVWISKNSSYTFALPAGDLSKMKIKAKSTDNCDCTDHGWVELVFTSLPVTFYDVWASRISGNTFWVNWQVGDQRNISHYNIQRSKDGVNWETITVVLGDDVQSNFKIKTDLTPKHK